MYEKRTANVHKANDVLSVISVINCQIAGVHDRTEKELPMMRDTRIKLQQAVADVLERIASKTRTGDYEYELDTSELRSALEDWADDLGWQNVLGSTSMRVVAESL